jgi:hypothetical protein
MTYMAILWVIGFWLEGYRPIGDRPLLLYSAALFGAGMQLVCLGVLAEMTFSVAETLEPIPDPESSEL